VLFREMIREASARNNSRIVLALDLEDSDRGKLLRRSRDVLQMASKQICAVKINRQLVLALGLRDGVDSIVNAAHELSLPAIMDAKLNDVGHTNMFMARSYIDAGFDALIASPVVGWEGGMEPVFTLANSRGKALIMLTYMSHPGAETFYSMRASVGDQPPRPLFEIFVDLAVEWKAAGMIVGATRPDIIKRVRTIAGRRIYIFSPGVGAQGGDPRAALDAGADYLIVGRTIYDASDVEHAARRYREMTE